VRRWRQGLEFTSRFGAIRKWSDYRCDGRRTCEIAVRGLCRVGGGHSVYLRSNRSNSWPAVALINLGALIATFYATSVIFVLVVLGTIAWLAGFSILRFIGYIKDELLIVLGTSSSETVLPHMMLKMERLGASKSVVGLVIPTGYSFNLDGTNIYMTLATLFLAQATNTPLTIGQELGILVIAMITSKGASGVTGAGFVTLAATLAIVPDIPIQSLALLVGIDKFMSECRALTNLVGNGVATVVISRWEGELDADKLHATMAHPITVGEEMEAQPV
jgi:aerobic C4-dicarboxylate transport protein